MSPAGPRQLGDLEETTTVLIGQCSEDFVAGATVPSVGAEIWIRVDFKPTNRELWGEARDRVLAVLDPAYVSYLIHFPSSRIERQWHVNRDNQSHGRRK